jgi:hypothetical protein
MLSPTTKATLKQILNIFYFILYPISIKQGLNHHTLSFYNHVPHKAKVLQFFRLQQLKNLYLYSTTVNLIVLPTTDFRLKRKNKRNSLCCWKYKLEKIYFDTIFINFLDTQKKIYLHSKISFTPLLLSLVSR